MRAVKAKDTKPELTVRRLLHNIGYRFRLHRADLPGNPDLVLPAYSAVIFVNGCFWHGHSCARGARIPKTNRAYWIEKIARNVTRDKLNKAKLRREGWNVITIWECSLASHAKLKARLVRLLT